MLLDWFVVVAQIVNFIIVIVVMKIFLYKPVLNKINQRQKKISDDIQDAADKQKAASDLLVKIKEQEDLFERQRREKNKKLEAEIKQLHDSLMEKARADVEKQKKEWNDELKKEEEEAYREFKKRIVTELFSIVRTSVESLSHLSLEEAVISSFLSQMQKQKLPDGPAQIKTAFEISPATVEKIQTILQRPVEHLFKPELIAGIELHIDGKKWSWNVEDYVSNLEKSLQ